MRAIAVTPGEKDSARLLNAPKPSKGPKDALLRTLRVGIDGTDREIAAGLYGEAPAGSHYLIIGHEAVCIVEEPDSDEARVSKGDLVVPTVRRPDDCLNCSVGESDMCIKGDYKEHGIRRLHGFASDYAVTEAEYLVKIPNELKDLAVLLEPLSIVEKAYTQIKSIQRRLYWKPAKALILGAGPLGLLANMLFLLEGFDVTIAATRPRDSLKAEISESAGAKYVNTKENDLNSLDESFDIVLEATGNIDVAIKSLRIVRNNGVLCLLGIYRGKNVSEDFGTIFANMVLGNKLVFGSVNSNKNHYEKALTRLADMKKLFGKQLAKMFTNVVKPEDYRVALEPSRDDVKTVIEFQRV